MYYIIWGFFSSMQPVPMAAALLQMLEFKHRKRFAVLYVLLISCAVWMRMFFLYYNVVLWKWCNAETVLVIAFLPVCMSKSRMWERALSSVLMLSIVIVGELGTVFCESIFQVILHRDILADFMDPGYAVGGAICFVIACAASYLISYFWSHKLHVERIRSSSVAVLLFPPTITEALIILGWMTGFEPERSKVVVSIVVNGMGISALISLCFLLFVILEQGRKERAERELDELLHQMDLERERYRSLEENREAVARFRHDFNNQLAALRRLGLGGAPQDAHALFEQLREKAGKLVDG